MCSRTFIGERNVKRMNVFCGPIYVARVEPFGTRSLLYIKMLLRAQKGDCSFRETLC